MSKLLPMLVASLVVSGAGLANAAVDGTRTAPQTVAASEAKIVVAQARAIIIRQDKPLPPSPCRIRCNIR